MTVGEWNLFAALHLRKKVIADASHLRQLRLRQTPNGAVPPNVCGKDDRACFHASKDVPHIVVLEKSNLLMSSGYARSPFVWQF